MDLKQGPVPFNPYTANPKVSRTSYYIYEAPVRLWHWINVVAILVLCITGYFIGAPLPSVGGEATFTFVMGYVRMAHFIAGYVLAVGFLFRIYWGFVGNKHSREIFYIPFWRPNWWREVVFEARWYAFLAPYPKKYYGHNPLAQLAMFLMFTCMTTLMIATGFAMYAEGAGPGHWSHTAFGWVIGLAGNTQNLHTIHHYGMWAIILFVIIHVYAAVREDIMSRQSMISTMVSGERMFKDDAP
ncbi:MAG: Ni/Fe-hydrogenase, b-type cytochrome subunit [Alphaproteobacteria bacterium]|nr:Ni/Fe-hydrogenase, b-type cytochrome subunit [Alphaproteobacteria bacterium]